MKLILKSLKAVVLIASLIVNISFATTEPIDIHSVQKKITQLESQFKGKIGVYAIDTNSNQVIAYRANTLFPIQSTFKLIGVAALLKRSEQHNNLLGQTIPYSKSELVSWSPVTTTYLNIGMTLNALSEAAISYSDNGAINVIMKKLDGPKAVTAFAFQIGNQSFNVKHYEPNLNSNPNHSDDSATPKDMALSVKRLLLGEILKAPQRKQLMLWMRNNTTGYKRIRAGVPIGWAVADKTGSGRYGIANDIGLVWSPSCRPIVLAIYTVKNRQNAKWQDSVVAETTAIVLHAFSRIDPCFQATDLGG